MILINSTIRKSRIDLIGQKIQILKYTELSADLQHHHFNKIN
ncbi:MAG TPA: hypothetical protein VIO43_09895 [Lutibacter sp.]